MRWRRAVPASALRYARCIVARLEPLTPDVARAFLAACGDDEDRLSEEEYFAEVDTLNGDVDASACDPAHLVDQAEDARVEGVKEVSHGAVAAFGRLYALPRAAPAAPSVPA